MVRVLLGSLVLIALAPSTFAQDGADIKEITLDGEKETRTEGKLAKGDARDKIAKGSPHHAYQLKFSGGGSSTIDYFSNDFDCLLRVEDSAGKQLALDDDGGGDLNSRLVFKAPKDDAYRVIATSYDGKAGNYILTIRKVTADEAKKLDPELALIGAPAPEIAGEFCLNGRTTKLSDLKGKVVLIDFWAVWCGPCIQTFPHLRDWDREYKKDGLEILGVTTYFESLTFDKAAGKLAKAAENLKPAEEHDMIRDFSVFHKLTHQLLAVSRDSWKKAGQDYNFRGIPTAVLVDRQGLVRMVRTGSGDANAQALAEEIRKLLAEK